MGWKSTINITREEAMRLILKKILNLNHMSDSELEAIVEELAYGEDANLEYYGHNFIVIDEQS